jgi:dCTP deaminase
MILTGKEIIKQVESGRIKIDPFDEKKVNPNSYNLTLADKISLFSEPYQVIIPKEKPKMTNMVIPDTGFYLFPGRLYLARTVETTETDHYVPVIDGRSSWARLGLQIHMTAGYGDIGFCGTWTLEMTVVHPLVIYPGVEICQIRFHEAVGDKSINYKNTGRYAGQKKIGESKLWQKI